MLNKDLRGREKVGLEGEAKAKVHSPAMIDKRGTSGGISGRWLIE